jgi:hypothetical protein
MIRVGEDCTVHKGECSMLTPVIWGLAEGNKTAERGRARGLYVDNIKEGSCQTRKQIALN